MLDEVTLTVCADVHWLNICACGAAYRSFQNQLGTAASLHFLAWRGRSL